MNQYLNKEGLDKLWTKIKNTFALKSHTHTKSQITDFPTIPTVNNPTITINQGGTKKGSFTLNQSGATTIDLTDNNTTYGVATSSANGLMSSSDKTKLDGIATGATKITVDSALSSTSTNPVQNKVIKSALDGKAASSHTHSEYVTGTDFSAYTTWIEGEVSNKADSGHTHNYAGSSSAGGAATSAAKLTNTSAIGSATQPVYFSANGVPVACTYTLEKSVPADAKFTDTNTWRGIQNNLTSDSTTDSLSAAQGKVLKGLIDGKAASSHTHNYLPLTGGTLTGAISYQGTKGKYEMIKWIDNTADTCGNGIRIGGGGATIIGGGESASLPSVSGGDEILYLMNDGNIDFYSNCQSGLSSAKHMTFDTSGNLNVPTDVKVNGNSVVHSGNIGSQSVKYATTAGSAKASNISMSLSNGVLTITYSS